MFKPISIAAVAFLIGTAAASAQSSLDNVLSQLRSQGYRQVEVERENGRVSIEAHRGTDERRLVYNARTGALLSDTADRDRARYHDRDSWTPARTPTRPGVRRGNDGNPASVLGRAGLGSVFGKLRSEGYRDIETDQRRGLIRIEAHKGSVERQLVYNARTGELLSDRVHRERDRNWDRDRDRHRTGDWDRDRHRTGDRARARHRAGDRDRDRNRTGDWDRDRNRAGDWDRDRDRNRTGGWDRDGNRDRDRDRDGRRSGGHQASGNGGWGDSSNDGRGGGRRNDDGAGRDRGGRDGGDDRGGRGRGGDRGNGKKRD
jgi:hypothetical protein